MQSPALSGTSSLTYQLPSRYQPYQGPHGPGLSQPPPVSGLLSYSSSCSSDTPQAGVERGIDTQIPAGQRMAHVGPSGEYGYVPDASQAQGHHYSGWCRLATFALPVAALVLLIVVHASIIIYIDFAGSEPPILSVVSTSSKFKAP